MPLVRERRQFKYQLPGQLAARVIYSPASENQGRLSDEYQIRKLFPLLHCRKQALDRGMKEFHNNLLAIRRRGSDNAISIWRQKVLPSPVTTGFHTILADKKGNSVNYKIYTFRAFYEKVFARPFPRDVWRNTTEDGSRVVSVGCIRFGQRLS